MNLAITAAILMGGPLIIVWLVVWVIAYRAAKHRRKFL